MSDYKFITIWKFNAPLEQVWDAIQFAEKWPMWWKGVVQVDVLENGDAYGLHSIRRFTFKSALPYKLSFLSKVTALEKYKQIEGIAYGELSGIGTWTFSTEDSLTVVRYDWEVKTTKWWMNALAPIARPAFEWNHDVIMKWGGQGLAEYLNCNLEE